MKREIKFRAWDKKTNKLYDVASIDMFGAVVTLVERGDGVQVDFIDRALSNVELMQYTGLKDRHGVDIYEGDVLREPTRVYLKSDGTTDKRYKCRAWDRLVVEWGEYSADDIDLVIGYEYDLCGEFAGWNINKKTAYEVIGNVYENPELLDDGVEK